MSQLTIRERPRAPKPPKAEKVSSSGKPWWTIALASVVAMGAAIVLLVVAGAVILGVGSSFTDSQLEVRELPPVAGAPEADFVMVVTPVGVVGSDAEDAFLEAGLPLQPGTEILPESTSIVSEVRTPFADHTIFRWFEFSAIDPSAPQSCFGSAGGGGGFTSCNNPQFGDDPTHSMSVSGEADGVTVSQVAVSELPADAAWIFVETRSGAKIVAAVVDGIGFAEWPITGLISEGSDADIIGALDQDFNELWTVDVG